MELSNESKTLFIPLYGKALMSRDNLFLRDKKAEEIINKVDYDFSALKQSKWLSMYMAVRAVVIDEVCNKYIRESKDLVVIHLGCGLDSRALRVKQEYKKWYDIDLENVITLRRDFYQENDSYQMIGKSVLDFSWLEEIDVCSDNILVVMEGLTMYLEESEIKSLLAAISKKLGNVTLLFDAYSKKAVRMSKYKNPVNQMKASIKWGMDGVDYFQKLHSNLIFVREYLIRYEENNLRGITKFIFENLYCGAIANSYYKIYEYKLKK